LSPLDSRVGEDLGGVADLDELAQMEEGCALRHARRLLHVVGDDHDRELAAQVVDQLLDPRGRDWV
jgi:hypothetical protein